MIKISGKFAVAFFVCVFVICASLVIPDNDKVRKRLVQEEDRVFKVLESLGSVEVDKFPNTKEFGVSAKRGQMLIEEGFSTKPGGGSTKKQSKHFVCTSCHNLEKEDPDLRFSDPQARLKYTAANGIPFLQATSLYGAVNRDSFYNGDYYKKYGDLVIPARDDIREAIQLCAVECAQGRKLKDWEIESILAFLWSIDLKLQDLELTDEDFAFIDKSLQYNTDQDSAIALIKSKYLKASPATFGDAQASREATSVLVGNPDNGKLIYENSCLHCHSDRKYSYFLLDDCDLTFKHLKKKAGGYSDHSIFQATRFGIYSIPGRRSYMPQYPMEKMSDQQLQDLMSYIELRAD